jgi:hypothetical protein
LSLALDQVRQDGERLGRQRDRLGAASKRRVARIELEVTEGDGRACVVSGAARAGAVVAGHSSRPS